jgi:photosystem II stability/assembly factor-like uncharacterized protein
VRKLLVLGLALGCLAVVVPATASAATWHTQRPSNLNGPDLTAIDCAAPTHCVAVGYDGGILVTRDSGLTWTDESIPTDREFFSVSCPTVDTCFAVTDYNHSTSAPGKVYKSTDGGSTWTEKLSAVKDFIAISCTSPTHCWTGGGPSKFVLATTDGGDTWSTRSPGTLSVLWSLSCLGTTFCIGASDTSAGQMDLTTDGGLTWSTTTPPGMTGRNLYSVRCVSTSNCVAVGTLGTARATGNGGGSWSSESVPTTKTLMSLDCASASSCVAGVEAGTIVRRTGTTWSIDATGLTFGDIQGVSCPTVTDCFAVSHAGSLHSTVPPGYSGTCTEPGGALFDGTLGSAYAKLRVQDAGPGYPGRRWVCFKLSAGGVEVGGRIDVDAAATSDEEPATDGNDLACSTTPGNSVPPPHPLAAGLVGGQPYLIDAYSSPGRSWICLRVGTEGRRVILPVGSSTPAVTAHMDSDPL